MVCDSCQSEVHFLRGVLCSKIATQEVSSWDVGTNGRKERQLAIRKLQEGWEEYDRLFDEHLKKWIASELTQEQLSQQIMATAAQLRAQSGGQWTSEVKAKIPELLAGIFALYAILRSGKAYMSALASATNDAEEKTEAVEPEERWSMWSVILFQLKLHKYTINTP